MVSALAAWVGMAPMAPAQAENFPARTVQIVVPFPPGGLTDGLVRQLATELGKKWKQSVVVENRGGGGTTIGTAQVARAEADGHTLLFTSTGFVTNQILMKSLPYEPDALAPVAMGGTAANVLYVHPSVPVQDVAGLLAYAKAHPGELKFASTGNGSSPHLTAELLASEAGIPILHVPYKGAGPALADLLAGHVNAMFHFPASLALVKQGKLRAIAVAAEERLVEAPDLTTFPQAGLPGVVSGSWFGFFAPAGTPDAVKDQIHRDVSEALKVPHVQRYMRDSGLVDTGMTRAQFAAFIANERSKWERVIKARNIRSE
ncbi:tripartite tricarboxylate transporter substrate binding protein [Pigmentiphaga sp.]|uniref:Bug family tripartite tricarboxylate transporter substrate binding protein n=2 Tax=Pigmentiphaga TaxID=152267 RepID=UPI0025EFBE12|nr:tripartite tricarboxylate transporter substrate-binding protein [Pigmentiphaga sp.]MBX6317734.1 tripartite tricarboxylate transporter substrate binding protein [Pigmentiphaga sp.]